MAGDENDGLKILIIGDIKGIITNFDDVKSLRYSVCGDFLDGIEAASREDFAGIGIELGDNFASVRSTLNALRQVNRGAKIIVFAKMYQEPAARRLVNCNSADKPLADDYLVCPVHTSHLSSLIRNLRRRQSEQDAAAGGERNFLSERQRDSANQTDMETVEKIRQLERLATEDELTGLKNRRYIREFSRQIIERAKSYNGRVTLLVFDIDNFKHYNDLFGHKTGDEILKEAAELMKRCCRGHDVVSRIGGDEFAVIFWDIRRARGQTEERDRRMAMAEHPKEVLSIARRFSRELQKSQLSSLGSAGRGVLTISGGLASFPQDGDGTEELFEKADKALLDAKRSGKNRIYLVGRPKEDVTGRNEQIDNAEEQLN